MKSSGMIDKRRIPTATTVVEEISPVEIRLLVPDDRVVNGSVGAGGGDTGLDKGRV